MSKPFFVRDCMRENPAKVKADDSVHRGIELIQQNNLTGLTVVDEDNRVVGVVSELDCLRAVIGNAYNEGNASSARIGDCMSTNVDTCGPDDDIVDVALAMLAKNQRRRPVVKDGKLVGQVSCRNILWAFGNYSGHVE